MSNHADLSRRQRQIMDALYSRGEATVLQIQSDLPRRRPRRRSEPCFAFW